VLASTLCMCPGRSRRGVVKSSGWCRSGHPSIAQGEKKKEKKKKKKETSGRNSRYVSNACGESATLKGFRRRRYRRSLLRSRRWRKGKKRSGAAVLNRTCPQDGQARGASECRPPTSARREGREGKRGTPCSLLCAAWHRMPLSSFIPEGEGRKKKRTLGHMRRFAFATRWMSSLMFSPVLPGGMRGRGKRGGVWTCPLPHSWVHLPDPDPGRKEGEEKKEGQAGGVPYSFITALGRIKGMEERKRVRTVYPLACAVLTRVAQSGGGFPASARGSGPFL